jgi:cation diffusion facilitator CzcD-associated flavoprotein CzcO
MEHFDVIVVGAGISGIGAGYHLQTRCPDHSWVILEGRADLGGTWDLFRYPGVRSDSDMYTLGYSFQPWTEGKSLADGPSIKAYLRRTAAEHGIEGRIRYRHQVQRADWSTPDARWTLTVEHTTADGTVERRQLSCNFLFMCSGYYSYKAGYEPAFEGRDDFGGRVVHPQQWPDDLDHSGQRVVVIGSGATAVTLVPAMAKTAAHVTMLQRSPTYIVSMPSVDRKALRLQKLLPTKVAYRLTRLANSTYAAATYKLAKARPGFVRRHLLKKARTELGPDVDLEPHFQPTYDPWDQRLCLVPDGDLFRAVREGRASVVTDHIERFTPTGIQLRSGQHLPADLIVTATGLNLVTLGQVDFTIDGTPVDFSSTWTYRGIGYSDVPNLASSFGYINASWTLRVDLTCRWVCQVLQHMRATGTSIATPRLRPSDRDMVPGSWADGWSSGYLQRAAPSFPKQGDRMPWMHAQSYTRERRVFARARPDDGVMQYTRPS